LGRHKRYKIAPIQQVWLHGHVGQHEAEVSSATASMVILAFHLTKAQDNRLLVHKHN
jgi:hypothetical protein